MSPLFNAPSRFVKAFLLRSKGLLISWLHSLSAVFEPKKIKCVTVSTFPPSVCQEVMGPDAMILFIECWVLSQLFYSSLSPSSRGSLVPLHFLPLEWGHLHIWGYWYLSGHSLKSLKTIGKKRIPYSQKSNHLTNNSFFIAKMEAINSKIIL